MGNGNSLALEGRRSRQNNLLTSQYYTSSNLLLIRNLLSDLDQEVLPFTFAQNEIDSFDTLIDGHLFGRLCHPLVVKIDAAAVDQASHGVGTAAQEEGKLTHVE